MLCFIFYFIFLHCPLSGPVLTYISLLIIPCMIVYVTNNKELWTLNLLYQNKIQWAKHQRGRLCVTVGIRCSFLLAFIKQRCIAAGAPFWIGGELPVFVVRSHATNRDACTRPGVKGGLGGLSPPYDILKPALQWSTQTRLSGAGLHKNYPNTKICLNKCWNKITIIF